ncbi:hypothetical protein ACLOJK_037122 [Asimina triloba]
MKIALQALPTPTSGEVEPSRRDDAEGYSEPTGTSFDNVNNIGDEFVNVAIHMVGDTSGTPASQSSQAYGILDPHIVKIKGRTAKRFKGPLEQPRARAKLCRGCNERVDPQRDYTFFRWFDEQGQTRSATEMDVHFEAINHPQTDEVIAANFRELLRCVEALKESHHAETSWMKLKHKALKKRVKRNEMDATVLRRNQDHAEAN